MTGGDFIFLNPGELQDGNLVLTVYETLPGLGSRVPVYRFNMRDAITGTKLGRIELRMGNTQDILLYTGHIGYRVEPGHRGHRYAARACVLLFDLARRHGYKELWITCDPDNVASRRTCEIAGGQLAAVVAVPESHQFYKAGSRAKCRYRFNLMAEPATHRDSTAH